MCKRHARRDPRPEEHLCVGIERAKDVIVSEEALVVNAINLAAAVLSHKDDDEGGNVSEVVQPEQGET